MAPPLPILSEETVTEKKKRNNQNVKADKKAQKTKFKKRYSTLKKKAEELETLCETKVCMVCFGPDGKFYTFPGEKKNFEDTIMEFRKNSNCTKKIDLLGFLEDKKKKLEKKKNNATVQQKIKNLFASWNDKIQELSENELMIFYDYLEKKLQFLIARSELLELLEEEEKGEDTKLCDEGESGPTSLNTNNFNVDQQSCNPLLPLGFGTDCSYNQMMSLNDERLAANCGIISTWPLGYYEDIGISSSNGSTSLLGGSNCNTGFEISGNFDLMSYNDNNMLRGEINDFLLTNNDFPIEFAPTDTSFEIPENFDFMGYNNNSIPLVEINSNILSNHDVSLEGFNTGFEILKNFEIPENFDMMEFAKITTDFGTVKNNDLMEESNNNFVFDDEAVSSQLSPLHYAVKRSMWQSSDGTKGCSKFNPSHDGI